MLVLVVVGCSGKASEPAPAPKHVGSDDVRPSEPTLGELPAGPVPVKLTEVAPGLLRTIHSIEGFVVIEPAGAIRYGRATVGATPFVGFALDRSDSAFAHLFMDDGSDHAYRPPGEVVQDLDAYGTLSRASKTDVLLLADASAPARLTLRYGIEAFGYRSIALAATAANLAAPYQFGGEPWTPWEQRADVTMRVDRIQSLGTAHPRSVLLQFTDASTTAELIVALAALGAAGVERVRVHRMMGWGPIPPEDIVWVRGATADDDQITDGDPATVDSTEPKVSGGVDAYGTRAALTGVRPRFRYCFEKRGLPKLRGKVQLDFDVAADGAISGAKAKGLDAKIAACVAGAVFDLDITSLSVHGPGHASTTVSFNIPEAPPVAAEPAAPPSGWWCWSADDIGICARYEEQCNASRYGAKQVADAMKDSMRVSDCAEQPTAWTSNNKIYHPSKATCGAKCRSVR